MGRKSEDVLATVAWHHGRILAQIVVAWGVLRQAVEEKVEPLLLEGEELLAHLAPQLAALA